MNNLDNFKISFDHSIRDAVKKMDEGGMSFCVCIDRADKVIGVLTDGDFRRAVHDGVQLDEQVIKIVNKDYISVQKKYTRQEVENIFNSTIVRQIPVLDQGELIDIVTIEDFYGSDTSRQRRILDNPVVIMAGGKGTRLDPFTRILPKPLIPLGNDPVIKVIMDEFNKYGLRDFYISLQEKERMVRAYFHDHQLGYHIKYLQEEKPLGTAGALKFLDGKFDHAIFVSNCDIIIRTDYGAFLDFHQRGDYALSMVGSMRQYTIPYGVCEADSGGTLKSIQEKPRFDFLVNTGMYLLQPDVLSYIPEDKFFNMTDLIEQIKKKGRKVGIFPVSEKSWIDVGQLSEYKEIVTKLNF